MTVQSELKAVTIYQDGAVCTRRLKLENTPNSVRVAGLPMSLVAASIRARVVTGAVGVSVLDARAGFDVVFGEKLDESDELKARNAARAALSVIDQQLERITAELGELHALTPAPFEPKRGEPPRPAPVEASLALSSFVDERLKTVMNEKRRLDKAHAEAAETVKLRERRLAEASSQRRHEKAQLSRAAVITLSTESASPLELELEYHVPGVRWVPNYTLRLEKTAPGGSLRMRASVAQDTGEDWKGVALSLSTASLLRRTDVPQLKSLRIGRSQPPAAAPGFRAPPDGLDELFDGYDGSRLAQPVLGASRGGPPPAPPPPIRQIKQKPMAPQAGGRVSLSDGGLDEEEATFGGMKEQAKIAAPKRSRSGGGGPPGAPPAMPAAPMMSSMAPPPMLERAMAKSKKMDVEPEADEAAPVEMMSEMMDSFDDEGATGSDLSAFMPSYQPAGDLLDYDRLTMPGPDAGSARGRLSAGAPFDFAFAVGMSISVDIVVATLATWDERWEQVEDLDLPPRCTPVASYDQFDFRYDCAAPVDVPSTGRWSTIPVITCNVGLTPQYVCVPSLDPKVFRTLTITNPGSVALLPGPVDVSMGDEFLLTTSLPAVPPGSNGERLGLGVEEAIKVARKTNFNETSGGFLGGSTVLKHDIEIELNNRLSTPAAIEVRERVPQALASEKDVKVEEVDVKPAWERVEGAVDGVVTQGFRRWRVTIPPGGRSTVSAQVVVRIPADKMLLGGNRRN